MQTRGGKALPLAVVEAALEVRDDGVERDLVRGGAPVREAGTSEAEAAVGVRVSGWRRRGEVEQEEEEAREGEGQDQCQSDGGRRRGLPRRR